MEPFIGQIMMFGGNFAPAGWAFCDGRILNIKDHPALFSVIGAIYGGDGRTNFALPDLRGRVPLHPNNSEDLSYRKLGEKSGTEFVTLNESEMPTHEHTGLGTINANNEQAITQSKSNSPENSYPSPLPESILGYSNETNTQMMTGGVNVKISSSGGSKPHTNMQPFLCINFIIAIKGTFPKRS
jgi:microcystin-dependent protein